MLVLYKWLVCVIFFLMIRRPLRSTRPDTLFPTRRSSDLRVGVIGVQHNHYATVISSYRMHLRHNFRSNGRALDHIDAMRHWMRLDGGTVMAPYIDVQAQYTSLCRFGV